MGARSPGIRRIGLRDGVSILIALGVVTFARSSLADHYHVPTGSMIPTVAVQDRVLVDKLAYGLRLPLTDVYLLRFDGPSRGDVVVLESPEDGLVLLKRVVAVPGDRVEVRGGALILDGREVPTTIDPARPGGDRFIEELGGHAHAVELTSGGGPTFGPTVVPPDRYLVMGDNRGNSHDGRMFGFVKRSSILGRAAAVFFRQGALRWIPL